VLFMLSQLFRAAGGMNQHLLSLDGHQARSAKACILSLAVLVAAAFLLTPVLGVMGMALAVIMADLVWAAALGVQAQQHAGYRGDILAVFSFRKAAGE
jgi:O-antigen/teichoic acid export membrane protein